jgi:hypothetical protein
MIGRLISVLALFCTTTFYLSCGDNSDTKKISDTPAEQVQFQEARNTFYHSYQTAPNEIKKSDIFNASRTYTCIYKKKYGASFSNWIGTVSKISTDQGGDEVTKFSIVSNEHGIPISYQEWGIKRGSPLYNQISVLAIGQKVHFTFSFENEDFSSNTKECFDEMSITELGSLEEPEFKVRFKIIR